MRLRTPEAENRSAIGVMQGAMDAKVSTGRRPEGDVPQAARGMMLRAWDVAFLVLVLASLAGIVWLGIGSYRAAHDLERLKRNAEHFADRLAAIGAIRVGPVDPEACSRKSESVSAATWGECFVAIRRTPDIAVIANHFVPSNPSFARSCSTEDPEVRGAIVVEKGNEWFSAGSAGTSYGPLGDAEAIDKEMLLRVRVCGRWGEPVTVREVRF